MMILTAVLVAAAAAALALLARTVWRLRGTHLVTCPETDAPAAVKLDLRQALLGAPFGHPALRLRACSRWPEHGPCGQPCLDQLEESPEQCEVRHVLTRWYVGRRCAYCRAPFRHVDWNALEPALLAPDGALREWSDLAPEAVPLALATHWPVCWNCLVAQRLRRERPDLFAYGPPAAPQPRAR